MCEKKMKFSTNFTLKFKFKREEFPLSMTKFGSNSQPVHGCQSWVNKILEKPLYENVLQVTSKLHIHKERRVDFTSHFQTSHLYEKPWKSCGVPFLLNRILFLSLSLLLGGVRLHF